jgi:hypothetical protein
VLTIYDLPTRPFRSSPEPLQIAYGRDAPAIPARPEIVLQLELLIQQRCVDLRAMSRLIVSDVGATLQVLRLAGREFGADEERPVRMEDCICALGLEACVEAISAPRIGEVGWQPALIEFWEHSRNTAHYCRMIAENMAGLNEDQATLVGLLHGMGSLPLLLGWKDAGLLGAAGAGVRLAKRCMLPECVVECLTDLQFGTRGNRWWNIVRIAHQSTAHASAYCPVWSKAGIERPLSSATELTGIV